MCVICVQILSKEAMKPTKLRCHLTIRHPDLQNKTKEYFERKAWDYSQQKIVLKTRVILNEKSLKASYLISQRIAKAKKPNTIGEDLIMPAALEICDVLSGSVYTTKLKSIPISKDTVRRRISEMSEDIVTQLTERLQSTKFAIQLHESIFIAGEAQLLAYVRYCWQNVLEEEFLFCKSLPSRGTADEIFPCYKRLFHNFWCTVDKLRRCLHRWCCHNDRSQKWCCNPHKTSVTRNCRHPLHGSSRSTGFKEFTGNSGICIR